MTRILLTLILTILTGLSTAQAQQQAAWVQIEAQPSLSQAKASIRSYASQVQDLNGFAIGGGWYAIALGPYAPQEARRILVNLRGAGLIPRDSYVAESAAYQQQFWPVGANLLNRRDLNLTRQPDGDDTETASVRPADDATGEAVEPEVSQAAEPATPEPEPVPADETPQQARASERELSRDQREDLQVALKWAGFYDGAIDAAFGRGTRNSMAGWQEANNYEPTGILTTRQRNELLRQYNAVLEGLGLKIIRDNRAGVQIALPTNVVDFDRYEAPFAHYSGSGDIDARVLLISQRGDRNTLMGLYDIMQTLEIVPENGPRSIEGDAFTLIGEGALFVSHTQAWLKDGEIKGFSLIWPAGDEERRTRLLGEMQESFTRVGGVLDPAAGNDGVQSVDLVAGLEIRRPRLSRSGFYVDRSGTVVTTSDVVDSCGKITIDEEFEAEIATRNDTLGIAVLRPLEPLAPLSVAAFQQSVPRLQSDVAVAGYSYGGVLGAPTLTFGQLADVRGLNGEEQFKRLALAALDGDAGGPVVDAGGAVLGMLLPDPGGDRKLPENVSFAADASAVRQVLEEAGISPASTNGGEEVPAEILTDRATRMTVLVSCWD